MNKNIVWIVVVLVVIASLWYLFSGIPAKVPAPGSSDTSQIPVTDTTAETSAEDATPVATVAYTDQGFSPKSVTVPLGATVRFVNQSARSMWVASAKHPSHTAYSDTNLNEHCPDTTGAAFDACASVASGGSYSFTFMKVGAWGYHNHAQAADFGTITVTATASQ